MKHKKNIPATVQGVDLDALRALMTAQPELTVKIAPLFELAGKGISIDANQAEAEILSRSPRSPPRLLRPGPATSLLRRVPRLRLTPQKHSKKK